MSTVQKFEDLEIWQKARELSKEIYGISNNPFFVKDFALKGQIQKSVGSIMDNIAEGFEREGKKEFVQFLSIAKGSSDEVRSQLYRAFDNSYIDNISFDNLCNKCININKMINRLIKYLKNSDYQGSKYK